MNLFERINSKLEELTPSQTEVATYALKNKEEILYINAKEMAEKAGVSESTVIRFASSLGFSGYKDFQKEVKKNLLGSLDVMQLFKEVMEERKHSKGNYLYAVKQDLENINRTFNKIQEKTLSLVVEKIIAARRIGVVGYRGTFAPAVVLNTFLNQLLGKSYLLNISVGGEFETILNWDESDLIISFDFASKENYQHSILSYAKKKNVFIISIINDLSMPAINLSDLFLTVESHSAYVSYTTTMVLVNVIMDMLNMRMPEEMLQESYRSTEQILSFVSK